MNPEFSKLQQRQQEELHQTAQLNQGSAQETTFETVDDLLRFDSEQNPIPPVVAEKLNDTLSQEQPPPASWWQRLFQ